MKHTSWILIFIYIICTVTDSYASEHQKKRYGKVFLMPLLIGVLIFNDWKEYLLYGALTGCWAGDLFLIHKNERRNMAGMFCFLAGHIMYLFLFAGRVQKISVPFLISGVFLYGFMMLFYFRKIWCHASEKLRLPSVIYMFAVFAMSFLCFLELPSSDRSLWITWIGTVLFLISDMLISDQLFRHLPQRWVMQTYAPAQLLIVLGLLFGR